MPTLIELKNFKEQAKLAKALNLDFIEINMTLPEYFSMDVNEVKAVKTNYNLELSMHLSETLDPFDLDPIIRQARLEQLKTQIKLGQAIGVFRYSMHLSLGVYFKLPNEKVYLYETYQEKYLKHVEEFIAIVESYDIQMCIENTGIHQTPFIQAVTEILLKSPHFKLTYDIGHDITNGNVDREFYHRHDNKIVHYHIHDGNDKTNHLKLYDGEFDIDGVVKKAYEKHADMVIEVKTKEGLMTSIKELKEKHENLFN